MPNLIVLLGPTASGKTKLAAHLAQALDTEIISADSRQIYRGMDIGTGKDLSEYTVNGKVIPHHLINIREAGENYHVADFQADFAQAFTQLRAKNKLPILCGGTGMYIDAVLKNYQYTSIPNNPTLVTQLSNMSLEELQGLFRNNLSDYTPLADTSTRKRLERAIQIAHYLKDYALEEVAYPTLEPIVFGLNPEVELRRQRITQRLHTRLQQGLVEEVQGLLNKGIPPEKLIFYGLEYKFITDYLLGNTGYNEMVEKLNIAIHQFAKRQMTYFRKMERDGITIHWLDAEKDPSANVQEIQQHLWNP